MTENFGFKHVYKKKYTIKISEMCDVRFSITTDEYVGRDKQ